MSEARRASLALLMLFGAAAIVSPASADTVKFYNGGTDYTGPFSGSGTVYDATKSDATVCPTSKPSCVSSPVTDVRTTSQTFNLTDGLTITATVNFISNSHPNQVWNDLDPKFGGLGVGRANGDSDTDQIAGHDVLKLTFTDATTANHKVDLTGIATLFASAHAGFGSGFDSVSNVNAKASSILFLLSVDGGSFAPISFADANNNALDISGSTFSFEQDPNNYRVCREDECRYKPGPQFYVSALDFLDDVCNLPDGCIHRQSNTPLPAAVWLFGSVIAGGAGVRRWRKSRKSRKSSKSRAAA